MPDNNSLDSYSDKPQKKHPRFSFKGSYLLEPIKSFLQIFLGSMRDILPIILVIGFFELFVIQSSAIDWYLGLIGLILIVIGLTIFIYGLEMGIFPISEYMAHAIAIHDKRIWIYIFGFCLGFGTTLAEPALIAISNEAANIAVSKNYLIEKYALGLRITIALAVGVAIVIGILKIFKKWNLTIIMLLGYAVVILTTSFAPRNIIALAYDAGGITTSTITVPCVTALGIVLARVSKSRNPMIDGFGLIALASLIPIIFVMIYGMIWNNLID